MPTTIYMNSGIIITCAVSWFIMKRFSEKKIIHHNKNNINDTNINK